MMVKMERLIELLYHKDKRIRDASTSALKKFYTDSDGIIEHILKSISLFKKDSLSLVARMKSFPPTSNNIHEIINYFYECQELEDELSINIIYHIISSFLTFPFEIIEENHDLFIFNDELKNIYEQAKFREGIRSQDPEILWNELERICINNKGKELKGEDYHYAELLLEGLKKYPEKTTYKIIMFLSQETTDNYHMEEFMVRLAGIFRIEETIPYLFRIFTNTDYTHIINNTCINSLGKIGTVQVVNEIEMQYNPENDSRDGLVSILGYIPYEFSEKLLIRFLKEEKNISIKTLICNSLCDIFSIKASDIIIETIEKRQYDPSMNSLCDALIPVYAYHNKIYDLSFLESQEADYLEETKENDPLNRMAEPLRKLFQQIESETKTKIENNLTINNTIQFKKLIQEPGRNDPCPCGSEKKYKKCCMLKKIADSAE